MGRHRQHLPSNVQETMNIGDFYRHKGTKDTQKHTQDKKGSHGLISVQQTVGQTKKGFSRYTSLCHSGDTNANKKNRNNSQLT